MFSLRRYVLANYPLVHLLALPVLFVLAVLALPTLGEIMCANDPSWEEAWGDICAWVVACGMRLTWYPDFDAQLLGVLMVKNAVEISYTLILLTGCAYAVWSCFSLCCLALLAWTGGWGFGWAAISGLALLVFVWVIVVRITTPRFRLEALSRLGWEVLLAYLVVIWVIYWCGFWFI